MDAWIAVAISAVGTVGGTALGATVGLKGAKSISREERAEAARADAIRAFGLFLGALYPVVTELHELPPVGRWQRDFEAWVNRVCGPVLTSATMRRLQYRLDGNGHREVAAPLAATVGNLQVLRLPPAVRAAIDEATDYIKRLGQQRSPELIAEWEGIHSRLMAANAELQAEFLLGPTRRRPTRLPAPYPNEDVGPPPIEASVAEAHP